jgi:hypothetical protein
MELRVSKAKLQSLQLQNQHGIAITQETISFFHRLLINLRHELMVCVSTRHHEQR